MLPRFKIADLYTLQIFAGWCARGQFSTEGSCSCISVANCCTAVADSVDLIFTKAEGQESEGSGALWIDHSWSCCREVAALRLWELAGSQDYTVYMNVYDPYAQYTVIQVLHIYLCIYIYTDVHDEKRFDRWLDDTLTRRTSDSIW